MNKLSGLLIASSLCLGWNASAFADHYDGHGGHDFHGSRAGSSAPHSSSRISSHGSSHITPRVGIAASVHVGHNHYYPRPGIAYRTLPRSYYTAHYRGSRYYFNDGIWYRPGGIGFIVARPPIGLFIDVLPPFYTTLWFGGARYYYANDVYYQWDPVQSGYVVSDPPPTNSTDNTDSTNNSTGSADNSAPPPAAVQNDRVFVYPRNGQSEEQTAKDHSECDQWATDQTGYDPDNKSDEKASVDDDKIDDYRRAEAACLDGRGYSVK